MRAITEWDIFREMIVLRSDTELDFEIYEKHREWERKQEVSIKSMMGEMVEPVLDTNIEKIDKENLDQLFIVVKYGKPINKAVYFRKGKIEIINNT